MANNYRISGDTLKAIADSIRGKTGKTDDIVVGNMAAEIDGIMGTASGLFQITRNGTYDVARFATVSVNVLRPQLPPFASVDTKDLDLTTDGAYLTFTTRYGESVGDYDDIYVNWQYKKTFSSDEYSVVYTHKWPQGDRVNNKVHVGNLPLCDYYDIKIWISGYGFNDSQIFEAKEIFIDD